MTRRRVDPENVCLRLRIQPNGCLNMARALFVTKGVLRLVVTVLACMALAALVYLAMVIFAWMSPPHG